MICNNCHEKFPDSAKFCPYCGTEASAEKPESHTTVPIKTTVSPRAASTGHASAPYTASKPAVPTAGGVYTDNGRYAPTALVFLLLIPIIANIICLNEKSSQSGTDIYYFASIIFCILSGIAFLIGASYHSSGHIANAIAGLFLLFAAAPLVSSPWTDGNGRELVGLFLVVVISTSVMMALFLFYYAIILGFRAYHHSMGYRMKCYEKLDRFNSLLEKGVISEQEFESLKNNLLGRMK